MNQGENLFIVFQGSVLTEPAEEGDLATRECLIADRKVFPKAEIILSTWKGAPELSTFCDLQINSEDPGALNNSDKCRKAFINNINRQIRSSINGLRAANRLFALKFRTDSWVKSDVITNLFWNRPVNGPLFRKATH